MSNLIRLQQARRSVRELPAQPAATPAELRLEIEQLARELDRSLADELQRFRMARERGQDRPDPAQPLGPEQIESLLAQPADEVTFFDLERLGRVDPSAAQARWEEVKAAARADFASGWHAARSLEYQGGSAWQRACFAALREQLRRAWPPRDEGEGLLLDELAQYELIRRHSVGVLHMRSRDPRSIISMGDGRTVRDDDRQLTHAAATQEVLRTVERLQRMIHNTVRTVTNLRRGRTPVIVRRAGQVNVAAGPQTNVQSSPAAGPAGTAGPHHDGGAEQ